MLQSSFLAALNYSSPFSTSPAKQKMTQRIEIFHKYKISKNILHH